MPEYKVEIVDRDSASLLELILEALIKQAVDDPSRSGYLKKATGKFHIQAGKMECLIEITGDGVRINRYSGEEVDARIKGDINSFFQIGTGSISPVPFITGKVRVSGKMQKAFNLGMALRGKNK